MRKPFQFVLAVLILTGGVARPAFAQAELRGGLYASLYSSAHQDEGFLSYSSPFSRRLTPNPTIAGEERPLRWSWVGEFRVGREWGSNGTPGSNVIEVLGGVRATGDSLMRWPMFGEVKVGLAHFPGSNVAIVHPSVGLEFKLPDSRRFGLFASVGTPIAFFSGNTEIGIEGGFGFTFPLGSR